VSDTVSFPVRVRQALGGPAASVNPNTSVTNGQSLLLTLSDKTLEQLDRSEPDSPVFTDELSGIYLTIRHYEAFAGLRKRAEIQYDRLPEEIKRSQAGKEMYVALHPPAKVRTNDRIADAESVDSDGETHRLSEYSGK